MGTMIIWEDYEMETVELEEEELKYKRYPTLNVVTLYFTYHMGEDERAVEEYKKIKFLKIKIVTVNILKLEKVRAS